jgi:hypothetical protein
MRVISYGGGVQSTALCVLATQGKIGQIDAALFANVGDDSEHPATIAYVREVMIPWCAERGLPVHELHRGTRTCTSEFKIEVIAKWLKAHGVTKADPATVLIGFSLDEAHRASNRRANPYEVPEHPLLDLHITRSNCKTIISHAGLPVPWSESLVGNSAIARAARRGQMRPTNGTNGEVKSN